MSISSIRRTTKSAITILLVVAMLLPLFSFLPAPATVFASSSFPVVSAGSAHSLAVRSDGSVWAWGYNGHGQLGDGTRTDISKPLQLKTIDGVKAAVSAGSGYSLAVKHDGTVWAWGRNSSGQLGIGTTTDVIRPVQVSGLNGIVAVDTGFAHSLALKSDGTVWAWGHNEHGQLGDGTLTNKYAPVQVSGLTGVVAISAGHAYSMAVKRDGTVWAWGLNDWGQLGDNSTVNRNRPVKVALLTNVAMVSAGRNHTLALKDDGTVWAWGRNHNGQLGIGTRTSRIAPTEVPELAGVVDISAGEDFSMAVKVNGTIWSWGFNGYGQLGDGTISDRIRPVQLEGLIGVSAMNAGNGYALAVANDNVVWAWGYNASGGLGDGTTTNRTSPVKVLFTSKITLRNIPSNAGTSVGSGEYEHGIRAVVTATPHEGYLFVNWTEDDKILTTDSSYRFTVTEDRILTANYISVLGFLEKYLKDYYPGIKKEDTTEDEISRDEISEAVYYTATAGNDLVFLLGWSGDGVELKLSVYNPSGQLHREVRGSRVPVVIKASDVVTGYWSFTVTGVKVPEDDNYYAVIIGEGKPSSTPTINPDRKLGDITNNGRIDVTDASKLLRHILGLETLSLENLMYADVNKDGRVDIQDVTLIMQIALNI